MLIFVFKNSKDFELMQHTPVWDDVIQEGGFRNNSLEFQSKLHHEYGSYPRKEIGWRVKVDKSGIIFSINMFDS